PASWAGRGATTRRAGQAATSRSCRTGRRSSSEPPPRPALTSPAPGARTANSRSPRQIESANRIGRRAKPGPRARHPGRPTVDDGQKHPPAGARHIAVPPFCHALAQGSAIRGQLIRGNNQMAKPAVIIVGGDKGGVGKTTVARTLLDYFIAHQVPTRAFDTEAPRGTLKRFHPDLTEVVDMTLVADQMKIFDTLNSSDASVTVIDVRAGLMSPT